MVFALYRAFCGFLVVAILAWVMPLGAFIKPSQEETACGGKRAFHMCHMAKANAPSQSDSVKIAFSSAGQAGHEKEKGGSPGNEIQLDEITRSGRENSQFYKSNDTLRSPKSYPRPIFHPPITTLF